jgi:signal transduction histidine kinase
MKKMNLLSKFIFIYICIAVLGFLAVTFVSYRIDYISVYEEQTETMYREAVNISYKYASTYFSDENLRTIESELQTVSTLNGTRIMFIKPNGDVVLDTECDSAFNTDFVDDNENLDVSDTSGVLYSIADFNTDNLGADYYQSGDFYGIFDETNISVFASITSGYDLKGYVAVHMPEAVISDRFIATFNTNYYTLLFVVILNILFIILYYVQVHRPIKDINTAIIEYGKGNFAYRIEPMFDDEIGNLAVSLDYMANKLNEMDQYQQDFLSNISHDFRSPLTSIKGYLEAIADGTIPPEQQGRYINIMLFETDRLTKLTSNILTLNEMDPKSVRLDCSNFDINSLMRHTIETFEGRCKKQKIQFQLTFPGEALYVYGDKGKIGQIIYNLIDNAIKFSPENSCIFVTVRVKGEKAIISIKDNGCGIDKESLGKIFDRFYKSDTSRGKDKKGSGLGLAIVKEILLAHNENIDVVSTVGVGTEFTFTLQLAKNSSPDGEDAQTNSAN